MYTIVKKKLRMARDLHKKLHLIF